MKAQTGKINSSRHQESSKNYLNASSIWLLFKFCIFEYVSKFHRGFLSIFTFKKHHMWPKKSRKVLFNLYFILPIPYSNYKAQKPRYWLLYPTLFSLSLIVVGKILNFAVTKKRELLFFENPWKKDTQCHIVIQRQ